MSRVGGKPPQVRQLEGRDPPDHLARQAQRLAAGGQHSHAGTALKQRHGEFCTGPEQMLAVVEQHYHSPVGKLLHNGGRGGPGAGQRQTKRCRGSRRYQPPSRIPDRSTSHTPSGTGRRSPAAARPRSPAGSCRRRRARSMSAAVCGRRGRATRRSPAGRPMKLVTAAGRLQTTAGPAELCPDRIRR